MPSAAACTPLALCLGGMDPSGGAGLLRDAATLLAFGVHPMAVCSAETLQNGQACLAIETPALDPLLGVEALRPHLRGTWGVKIGLWALPSATLAALAAWLAPQAPAARIWDPVQAPSSGVGLHRGADLRTLAKALLKDGGWVVSPNRLEASAVADLAADQDPLRLATPFLEAGARAVWLKGGHSEGEHVQDVWIDAAGPHPLERVPRLQGELRGSGCALASAWLALRLLGRGEREAAREAAAWLRARWASAFAPGGYGRPVIGPEGAA